MMANREPMEYEAADRWRVGAGRLRILVVHTDAVFRTTAADVLTRSGHTVRTARDGGTGVGLTRSWQPDVVVMGFVPQRLDGWTAHRVATQGRGVTPVPVVVVGEASADERDAMRETGIALVPELSSESLATALQRSAVPG